MAEPKVVILCGGAGTRLREETEYIPKPMVAIGDKPILWHIMKTYAAFGFYDFILCLGYKGDVIRNFFLNYDLFNSDITINLGSKEIQTHATFHDQHRWNVTLAETGEHTMTGGRARRVKHYIEGDTFMLTYGDGVGSIDLRDVLRFHHDLGRIATVTAVHPLARFGELTLDGDVALRFNEKPQGQQGWINGGFFVFNRKIFDYLEGDDCVLEREPMERLAADGELAAYRHNGYWQYMDTLRDKELLNAQWSSGEAPWAVWRNRQMSQTE